MENKILKLMAMYARYIENGFFNELSVSVATRQRRDRVYPSLQTLNEEEAIRECEGYLTYIDETLRHAVLSNYEYGVLISYIASAHEPLNSLIGNDIKEKLLEREWELVYPRWKQCKDHPHKAGKKIVALKKAKNKLKNEFASIHGEDKQEEMAE